MRVIYILAVIFALAKPSLSQQPGSLKIALDTHALNSETFWVDKYVNLKFVSQPKLVGQTLDDVIFLRAVYGKWNESFSERSLTWTSLPSLLDGAKVSTSELPNMGEDFRINVYGPFQGQPTTPESSINTAASVISLHYSSAEGFRTSSRPLAPSFASTLPPGVLNLTTVLVETEQSTFYVSTYLLKYYQAQLFCEGQNLTFANVGSDTGGAIAKALFQKNYNLPVFINSWNNDTYGLAHLSLYPTENGSSVIVSNVLTLDSVMRCLCAG